MTNYILHTVEYFALFSYPPTTNELYTFLNIEVSEREFKINLNKLITEKKIVMKQNRIALSHEIFTIYEEKYHVSQLYYQKAQHYLLFLKIIPSLQLLGISGSLSMMNTKREGDIDLFVISDSNKLWTTRFILLIYKYALKVIDSTIANKLCFNLFFSENGLEIAKEKQNEYIAHELLQIKILINKKNCYSELIQKNKWIHYIFPNVISEKVKSSRLSYKSKSGHVEVFFEYIQKLWLKRKKIGFREINGQLWFIQDDFESKLPKKYRSLYQQSK